MMVIKYINMLGLFIGLCSCSSKKAETTQSNLKVESRNQKLTLNASSTMRLNELTKLLIEDDFNSNLDNARYFIVVNNFINKDGLRQLFITFDFNDDKNIDNDYIAESEISGFKVLYYGFEDKSLIQIDTSAVWYKRIYPKTNELYPEFDPLPIDIIFHNDGNIKSAFPIEYLDQIKDIMK